MYIKILSELNLNVQHVSTKYSSNKDFWTCQFALSILHTLPHSLSSCLPHPALPVPLVLLVSPLTPLFPGYLDDLYSFNLVNMVWTQVFVADSRGNRRPSARYGHGFASAGDKLYVHGGVGSSGNARAGEFEVL